MPRSKYGNRRVKYDGYNFDSEAELARYKDLKLLHRAGEIHKLKIHPRYRLLDPFTVKGIRYKAIDYIADFEFVEDGKTVVVDVKGVKTQVFRLKKKLFLKRYGDEVEFRIEEV